MGLLDVAAEKWRWKWLCDMWYIPEIIASFIHGEFLLLFSWNAIVEKWCPFLKFLWKTNSWKKLHFIKDIIGVNVIIQVYTTHISCDSESSTWKSVQPSSNILYATSISRRCKLFLRLTSWFNLKKYKNEEEKNTKENVKPFSMNYKQLSELETGQGSLWFIEWS